MIRSMYHMRELQQYIDNPDVLSAVIRSLDYTMVSRSELKVEPAQAADIIKQGKSPAAEAIAPVATDPKLVTRLANDARKGVRMAALKNPHLTQDDLEKLLKRSMKDADHAVALPAAKRLESPRVLKIVSEHTDVHYGLYNTYGQARRISGLRQAHAPITHELLGRLPEEGVELLRGMHEARITDYVSVAASSQSFSWFKAGMLTWMAPEMEPSELRWLLMEIWERGLPLLPEDMEAVQQAFERAEDPADVKYPTDRLRSVNASTGVNRPYCAKTVRLLYELDPSWHLYLYEGTVLPADLQHAVVSDILRTPETRRNLLFTGPRVPGEFEAEWAPDWDNLSDEARNYDGWLEPSIVGMIVDANQERVEGLVQGLFTGQNPRPDNYARVQASNALGNVIDYVGQLIVRVHPDRRREIAPEALALGSLRYRQGYQTWHIQETVITGFRAWLQGELDDKPTPEKVVELVDLDSHELSVVRMYVQDVASAGRVSLLLGGLQKHLHELTWDTSQAGYLVFQHYFGDNPDAWSLAIELANGWEDTLEELAITVCAASGMDLPTEVVDLVDLRTDEDDEPQPNQDEEHSPTEEDTTTESDEPTSAEDTPDGDASEAGDDSSDSEETEPEDVDITDPVMFTLF